MVETAAPDGYSASEEVYRVTVVSSETTETYATLEVPNTPASALPSTGGSGTALFYAAGSALVIIAVCTLLIRRKRRVEEI